MKAIAIVAMLAGLAACRTCPTVDEKQIKEQYYNLGLSDANEALIANNRNCIQQNDALREGLAQVQMRLAECLEADKDK